MDQYGQYSQRALEYTPEEKKILGLFCAYYAYLENIDRQHEAINGRTYPFPSSALAWKAERARSNAGHRLGLASDQILDKDVRALRDQALHFTFEEQMVYAANTGMYEELMKDLKR